MAFKTTPKMVVKKKNETTLWMSTIRRWITEVTLTSLTA
jgi:hypothetical protein